MSKYSDMKFTEKLDEFNLFIEFLKEDYPDIKDKFFEWKRKKKEVKGKNG